MGANSITSDGTAWRVDVAMSRAFLQKPEQRRNSAAVEVSKPTIVVFESDATTVRRWRYPLA